MANISTEIFALNNAAKIFPSDNGPTVALTDISLSMESKGTLSLVGPSGCGKTTILLLLAGLEKPTGGELFFKNKPLNQGDKDLALMLQNYGLFPWKTVRRNVELGLRIRKAKFTKKKVEDILEELGIPEKANVYPQQLSGGQRQRVALARSLILNPSLMLLDEPFAALDTLTRERLQMLLLDIYHRREFSMVLATHNIPEAVRLGGKIVIMDAQPGRIRKVIDNPAGCKGKIENGVEFNRMVSLVRDELESGLF